MNNNPELPEAVREWFREKGKQGGRKVEHDDEKHTKAREYMRAYRERKRKEKRDGVKDADNKH